MKKDPVQIGVKFARKNDIESVKMGDIAKEAGASSSVMSKMYKRAEFIAAVKASAAVQGVKLAEPKPNKRVAEAIKLGVKKAKLVGVEKVSVNGIAKDMNVSGPALFQLFGTREKFHAALRDAMVKK